MIRTDKLRGIISERGMSQSNVAHLIGITPKTFYEKMSKGVFGFKVTYKVTYVTGR